MEDVKHEDAMDEFKRRYPADYKAYMAAKYGITEGKAVTYSADTLQQAIERKREVYRELYTASNKALLGKISGIDKPLFVSQYAPLVIVEASKQEIMTIAQSANVVAIEVCGNSIESTTREYEYPSDFTISQIAGPLVSTLSPFAPLSLMVITAAVFFIF
jgi:hypothetical protein